MATTTRGRAQDRAKVAGGQDHEVRYEAKKEGVSKGEVQDAVKKVGNSRKRRREASRSLDLCSCRLSSALPRAHAHLAGA